MPTTRARAAQRRGHRQHARSGAEIQHRAIADVDVRQAAAGTSAWSRDGRCRIPSTARSRSPSHRRSSAGRSHGGATMKRPARTAVSDCCDRAAQSSSGKIDGLDGEVRAAASRIASAARSRSPASLKHTFQCRGVGGGSGIGGYVGSHSPPGRQRPLGEIVNRDRREVGEHGRDELFGVVDVRSRAQDERPASVLAHPSRRCL